MALVETGAEGVLLCVLGATLKASLKAFNASTFHPGWRACPGAGG
jgi:hypothetical protein